MRPFDLVIMLSILLLMAACQQPPDNPPQTETAAPTPSDVPTEQTAEGEGYPGPAAEGTSQAYPPPSDAVGSEPYPSPGRETDESKRFEFDEPVEAGSTEITGTGYPQTPIKIVSISHGTEEIGSTTVEEDRSFRVTLSRPVEEREVLGIQLADPSMRPEFRDAPGTDIPLIGLTLAQTIVQ